MEPASTTSRWRDGLLRLLLATDASIIALHLLHECSGRFRDLFFSIEHDRGLGESFQYVKLFWMALALTALAARRRSSLFLGWAALSGWMLADDVFELHEKLGKRLSERLGFQPTMGLRPVDLGELLVCGVAGSLLLGWIGLAHRRGSADARSASRTLFLLLLALAAFGIGVDMIHIMEERLLGSQALGVVLGTLEDGGEMVVVSFMTWFVLRIASRELAQTTTSESKP